jgi:hypothetical protein
MSFDDTPHVCFRADFGPEVDPDRELPQLLERQFRSLFDSARVINTRLFSALTIVLGTADNSFSAVLGKSKYNDREWILLVGPQDQPTTSSRLLGHEQAINVSALREICRKIHELLTSTPGLVDIRWYFEGTRRQTAAVATPGELPWARS